ncbi:MAG: hypothetical protein JW725_02830 [Candidatus Babeliaceae bacterium]|nr:hypothetical protein [Candidatus Babeliaceae bacterium]
MRKCVKIILTQIDSCERFVSRFKKNISLVAVEGIVEYCDVGCLEITLHGNLDEVNNLIGTIEEFVIRHNVDHSGEVLFAVEPCMKSEDYRGVVRFVKRQALRPQTIRH